MIRIEDTAEVNVLAPFYARLHQIEGFIRERSAWVAGKVDDVRKQQRALKERRYAHGEKFLFLGKKFPLNLQAIDTKRFRIDFTGFQWDISLPRGLSPVEAQEKIRTELLRWYRLQAEEILGGRIFHYSRIMGIAPEKVAIRAPKRIWGSCNHRKKVIHLNWQLILTPLEVIDYVVVHELCHLKVPDHSNRFWNEVTKVIPEYKRQQKWLKSNRLEMVLP